MISLNVPKIYMPGIHYPIRNLIGPPKILNIFTKTIIKKETVL